MFSPAQITSCGDVSYVVDSYDLPKLFLLTEQKSSKLTEVTTVVLVTVCQGRV